MKRNELKKILKPLIKECIKEVIFEEGVLSTVISEVMRGTSQSQGLQASPEQTTIREQETKQNINESKNNLSETRKRMLDAIGKNTYGGVDLFENTTPLSAAAAGTKASAGHGALADVDPNDSGVDISNLPGKNAWKHLIK
tara:strand:+ start:1438 stop:1860 length:423 start_codon:yes stop_codon:yes gene_type:complete